MSRIDAVHAISTAFEAGYEDLFLSIRPHATAAQSQAICRAAFKYLIRKYLKQTEMIIADPDCLLHTAHAFAQVQIDKLRTNSKTSNHQASSLSD